MDIKLPPLQELELLRQSLVEQIETAERIFSAEDIGHELLTSKAALQCVEQAIRRSIKVESA